MNIKLSPSLICTDLCNLEQSVNELSELDIDMLHIDILDGYFSPSMPMGLDVVRALRKKTSIPFDFHLMAKENDFFINEIIDIGAQQICFQFETETHVDRLLNKIKKAGINSGVALIPSTPVSVLEYVIEKCDFIMLMLINPGFAGDKNEEQVSYALRKVNDCYKFIKNRGYEVPIEIDGRIATKSISDFICAGSDILVLGSKSLFLENSQLVENMKNIRLAVTRGIERRAANEIS
jgi:ribulose-phosphate 3-epimerase